MNKSNELEKEYSAIILAAGKSERLGFPKLSLKFNGQYTFLEQIAQKYSDFGCKEVLVIVNQDGQEYIEKEKLIFPKNTRILVNKHPEWHRFYSLKIGAQALNEFHSVFVHNVDNPFVSHYVLGLLLEKKDTSDYIIPEYQKNGGHPILLSDKIMSDINSIKEGQLHMKEFLNQYSKLKVPVQDEKVLVNINTANDYKNLF